jgi:Uma2 family endonuclease
MAVEVERTRRLFTIQEYDKMVETGILTKRDRVELIDGEVVEMSPIGDAHAACVSNLTHLLIGLVGEDARVWVQGPVRVPPRSKPQPDLALLRPRSYMRGGAAAADALLFIEVADASLRYDRTVKLALYAGGGIPEYWIVDTSSAALEVYRNPSGNRYTTEQRCRSGERIAPLALPAAVLSIDAIFA